jgi:hypothetical protein
MLIPARLRHSVVLAVCAVLAVGFAALAVVDPFHLRHARWFTAALVLLALVLVTAALAVAVGRGALRMLVLALGGVAVLGWVTVVGFATQLDAPSREVSEVADGGRRLVVLEAPAGPAPVHAVVLRSGGGPFEQETVVYQGVAAGPVPEAVRFVDPDTVEVRTRGGCTYRSEVEAVTLAVDPVHHPLQPAGC